MAMQFELSEVEIRANPRAARFEATVNGSKAFISYRREDDRLVLDHTWVPPELEGRGLAGKLTQSALDYARTQRLKVVPECPYVAVWLRRHPEYQDLVAKGS